MDGERNESKQDSGHSASIWLKLKRIPLLFWRGFLRDLVLLAVLIFGARSVIADWNHVPSGSMKPTLVEGDLIFVNRLAYDLKFPFTRWHLAQWDDPQRGDIVVFDSPSDERLLVKRVIGLPGDELAMVDNVLFINGARLDYTPLAAESQPEDGLEKNGGLWTENLPGHPHPVQTMPLGAHRNFGPVSVPAGQYLMLGDNRDNSADSRYFGFVERERILGQAIRVLVSWDPGNYYIPRDGRFFVPLN